MKMVAASKLRKAQVQAEASQPYAQSMADMLARVAQNVTVSPSSSKLLVGTGSNQKHLIVVVTSDRGLCGGFNANLVRDVRKQIKALTAEGKDVSLLCVGRKGRDLLNRGFARQIIKSFTGITGKSRVDFADVNEVTEFVLEQFEAGAFDVCTLAYNHFKSVLTQTPTMQQLIPFKLPEAQEGGEAGQTQDATGAASTYDFEPEEAEILDALLPKNIGVQLYRSTLDSSAGEQAARMTAMDNATRNAGDMIDKLTLQYNRARQAQITTELIEIIAGAEAV